MIVGMDFGTTNSGMAVYDGQRVQVLDIDPSNTNSKVARTALYVTNDQQIYIGRQAVDQYFDHNIGRPVKMERVWVGEIEMTVSDMSWLQDVYVWIDALSPGRLFLSVKTSLSDTDYVGTVIEPYFYSLEDLIALYLNITRHRAETQLDQELRQVVLGRPVKFSNDPQKDKAAQERLISAAFKAGYETVYFQREPIAAALHYEQSLDREANVLIFDFGGGTLDITIMRLGNPQTRAVLATGGVPIAGDIFDQKLIRGKLPKHFGEGTIYGPSEKPLTVPNWIHNTFSNWQTILQLQTPKNVQLLQSIARTARDASGINALISLVSGNYGLSMFDSAERAKRRLSRRNATMIPLSGPRINIRESVTRAEFEAMISHEFRIIEENVDETLEASGLRADQIDAVIRTGGSSQIPIFEAMLQKKFGPDKVQASNIFSGVTSGLGITAHGIEAGIIEAEAHRPETNRMTQSEAANQQVKPVNLDILLKQFSNGKETKELNDDAPISSLVTISNAGSAVISELSNIQNQLDDILLSEIIDNDDLTTRRILQTMPETVLLWLTSHYRFLLMTPRQIAAMGEGDASLEEVQRFVEREVLCTVAEWLPIKKTPVLIIVTTDGIARRFQMHTMRTHIESPTLLRLDRPLDGLPIATLGVRSDEEIFIVTERGRGARVRGDHISVQGKQVISRGKNDIVVHAATVKPDDTVILVTADGHARRFRIDSLPPSEPKAKSTALITRRPVRALAIERPDQLHWLATDQRLILVDVESIPMADADSKIAHPLVTLDKGEEVRGIFAI